MRRAQRSARRARDQVRALLGRRSCRGAVTAETAVVLPVLLAVALGLVWLLGVAVAQMRVVDAARETARALARDEAHEVAVALGDRVAPDDAQISVTEADGLVTVRVSASPPGPAGIFRFLPGVTVQAEAVAATEPS